MKQLEQQILYRLGKIEKENEILKGRIETLTEENQLLHATNSMLQAQIKLLPCPTELEIKENLILLLQGELEKLKKLQQREQESTQQVLMDNANNLKELIAEKTKMERQLEDQNSTIKEKEHALKEYLEIHQMEKEQLKVQAEEEKNSLKLQAEEDKKQIAEAWKKELAKKSRWNFW